MAKNWTNRVTKGDRRCRHCGKCYERPSGLTKHVSICKTRRQTELRAVPREPDDNTDHTAQRQHTQEHKTIDYHIETFPFAGDIIQEPYPANRVDDSGANIGEENAPQQQDDQMDEDEPESKMDGCRASLGSGLSNITVRTYKEETGRDAGAPLHYDMEDERGLIDEGDVQRS